ncbi:hypothetical protein ACFVWN_00425 [Nocardiopsis flavescens]|uniref:hypothetical protein n=1 Tax=Nocardiopsis flavescens TaxID=758803 RepID=UPI00364C51C9
MAKARKSTWRSGGGWWDSPRTSRSGYTGDEILSPAEEKKTRVPKRRGKPRFGSEEAKAQGAEALARIQKLAVRARGAVIAHPDEAGRICCEALSIRPRSVLKYKDRSGRTYLQAFTELLEEAERSAARKARLSSHTPRQRKGTR